MLDDGHTIQIHGYLPSVSFRSLVTYVYEEVCSLAMAHYACHLVSRPGFMSPQVLRMKVPPAKTLVAQVTSMP